MVTRAQHALAPVPGLTPSPFPAGSADVAYEDLIESPLELTLGRTLRGVRTFLVPDVAGAGIRVLSSALNAPNVPRYGESWPGIDALLCTEVTVRPSDGPNDMEVVATYGFPVVITDPYDNPPGDDVVPFLEIVSSVVMKKTNMDIEGVPIVIDDYFEIDPDSSQSVRMPAQPGEVDVPVRNTVLRYRRREWPEDSRGRLIGDKCVNWTGVTNEELFLGFPIGSLLVVVGASSDDGDETFNVTYELHHNIDTWDPTVVYRDPMTGRPASQVGGIVGGVPGNGVKRVIVTGKRKLIELDLRI